MSRLEYREYLVTSAIGFAAGLSFRLLYEGVRLAWEAWWRN